METMLDRQDCNLHGCLYLCKHRSRPAAVFSRVSRHLVSPQRTQGRYFQPVSPGNAPKKIRGPVLGRPIKALWKTHHKQRAIGTLGTGLLRFSTSPAASSLRPPFTLLLPLRSFLPPSLSPSSPLLPSPNPFPLSFFIFCYYYYYLYYYLCYCYSICCCVFCLFNCYTLRPSTSSCLIIPVASRCRSLRWASTFPAPPAALRPCPNLRTRPMAKCLRPRK